MDYKNLDRKDIIKFIKKKLPENIVRHVLAVEELALKIANCCPEVDINLISSGALLHDIGRSVTHSIKHAIEGAKILKNMGLSPKIISVVENHIGAGITKNEAKTLGLPEKNYIPKTVEEKIVAAADNLLSGDKRRNIKLLIDNLDEKGAFEAAKRVKKLHDELSILTGKDLNEL